MSRVVLSPGELLAALAWRYATQKFDPARRIDDARWAALEQALVLSASSFGLQPWRFIVVGDPALRARLRLASWGQPQVTDASHLVVLARRLRVTPADVDRHLDRTAEVRGAPRDSLAADRGVILASLDNPAGLPGADQAAWTRAQVYLALGQFLTAAALLGVDACPLEGFDAGAYDGILGLPAQGFSAVVVAAAGYRAKDDDAAALAKVRFRHDDVVRRL